MSIRKKTSTYGDIFANISPAEVAGAKKPLAKAFFTAHEDRRGITYYPDIIFKPREPYFTYGLICEEFRCNINQATLFGEAFEKALKIAIAEEIALAITYNDRFAKLLFTVTLEENASMVYHSTAYGWTCHYGA